MKKLMALFLAVVMVIPMTVCAEDTYVNGVATEEKLAATETNLEMHLTVNGCADIPWNTDSYKKTTAIDGTSYVVYRIHAPQLEDGQIYEKFNFSFVLQMKYNTSDSIKPQEMAYLFKLPAEINSSTKISDVSAYLDRSNKDTYPACDSPIIFSYVHGATSSNYSFWRGNADITSYANECLLNKQQYIYIAVALDAEKAKDKNYTGNDTYCSIRTSTKNASGKSIAPKYSFTPSVEYKAYAPLVVSSDASLDNASYESAESSAIAVGSAYKTAFKIANNTGADKDLKLVFACYTSGNELVGLVFEDAKAETGSTQVLMSSGLAVPATTSYVKAFVMDAANYNPVTTFEKVDITQN